jgi:hypothetical protein
MTIFDLTTRFFDSSRTFVAAVGLLTWAVVTIAPAVAAEIPDDHARDVLIRSTLSTFNDANMTNNYSVFFAKSAKELQALAGPEKMSAAFEVFRRNQGFFENVVSGEYKSTEKPIIDTDGGLVLVGVLKVDDMDVTYNLKFLQNDNVWKVVGIDVNVNRPKKL